MILNNEMLVYQAWICLTFYCSLLPILCFLLFFPPSKQQPLILQSLEFDLIVYAPYRSVEGFINYMEVSFAHVLFSMSIQQI